MAEETGILAQAADTDETSFGYMLKLAGPMIVTTISFTIMQFVDRFMVSRLGTAALAAVLPAGLVSFLPASFAIGAMASVTTFVSQSLGRGQKRDCSNYLWQAVYMGLVFFALVTAVMWPSAPWIFKMLGHKGEVAEMEVIYLRIMLYAQTMGVFVWSSSQFFMGIHRPIITMYAAICGQIVNIAANYVLIFGKFGFPAMGIAGAGWGTFLGTTVGAAIRMTVFLNSGIHTEFKSRETMNIDVSKMLDLLKVGLAAGCELMINVSLWGVILFALVGRFGKEAMAATSVALAWTNISVMPVVGIGYALTAAVGKSIGKGRKEMAVKQTDMCMRIALVYTALVGLCFFIFRHSLVSLWSSDDIVIGIGVKIMIMAAVYQVFYAARTVYSRSLRGAGDTVWLAVVSVIGAFIILGLGGVFILVVFPELGAIGPWLVAMLSIIAVGLANRIRFKSNRWMAIELFKPRGVGAAVEVESAVE